MKQWLVPEYPSFVWKCRFSHDIVKVNCCRFSDDWFSRSDYFVSGCRIFWQLYGRN